jgi:PKD repeat protein
MRVTPVYRLMGAWLSIALIAPLAAQEVATNNVEAEESERIPTLVTFGKRAPISEGDHDFKQIIRIEIPAEIAAAKVRIFDPDIGGQFDEPNKGFNSRTQFSLYGAGTTITLPRDADNVIQEALTGTPLDTAKYGYSEALDGTWVDVFELEGNKGEPKGDVFAFYLLVEGIVGNDGNVFDVDVVPTGKDAASSDKIRQFTYLPTFQVPDDPELKVEYRFDIPADAKSLLIENFDAAGAGVFYEERFRVRKLTPSDKSNWQRDRLLVYQRGSSVQGSITTSHGEESPNDLTVYVGARSTKTQDGADQTIDVPVALELPPRFFRDKPRPDIAYSVTPLTCNTVQFDANMSADPAGGELSIRWRASRESAWSDGPVLRHEYSKPGVYYARLELFNQSRRVGNGVAHNVRVVAKPAPVAAFTAPALVAEAIGGTIISFDASSSSAPNLPLGNQLSQMVWDFGDGTTLVQAQTDEDFGRPSHRYEKPGSYRVLLSVVDDPDHPCNSDGTQQTVTINGTPQADGGRDREVIVGAPSIFDGSSSADPEGRLVAYVWQFGDGNRTEGRRVSHSYHEEGTYQVSLTVTDGNLLTPLTSTQSFAVTAKNRINMAPQADAGPDRAAIVGRPMRFDGSGSADSDGNILFYTWQFADGGQSRDRVIDHTFWAPGDYRVSLTVEDNIGGANGTTTDEATIRVSPAPTIAPVAALATAFDGVAYEPITFNAAEAADADGSIVRFDWDFGDGTSGTGRKIDHLYTKAGTYQGQLSLTDNSRPAAVTVVHPFSIDVAHRANQMPIARAGDDVAAKTREAITFDGTSSDDPDGSVLSYRWKFGDGHVSSGAVNNHIYQFAGTYQVELTVEDDNPRDPLRHTDTLNVTITDPENQVPIANAAGGQNGLTGQILQFDGAGSSDPDGNIMAYSWEFGDGGRSQHARPQHAFHDPGDYLVRLTVSDDGSPPKRATSLLSITVRAAQ